MILDDLDFVRIEKRLYELDAKIDAIKVVEKEKAELIKYQRILEQYRIAKVKNSGRLNTAQNSHELEWYRKFPFLALHLGVENSARRLCRYCRQSPERYQ